jgi:lipid-binding SYLF domain-containing protein
MHQRVETAITQFKEEDPTIQRFFDSACAYAVFPTIGKGGFLIGGARGRGEVYEGGNFVGYTTLTQGTIGAQAGGQTYSEIIFFQNPAALAEFRRGDVEFAGQASAVAATHGASANADYEDGVAVFTIGEGGLMFEAAVGGQRFHFEDARNIDPSTGYAIPMERREDRREKAD